MTIHTEPKVFPAGEQELARYPFGEHAQVTVWQGIGDTGDGGQLGAGYATYQGQFDWILQYDAVYYFLEGELEITHDGAAHKAGPGDVMFLPRGASVTYHSPGGCRIFWAIYPGNWEEISDFSVAQGTSP
jgi:ethanolamine utilization protein EutQ (cupin superfamily)